MEWYGLNSLGSGYGPVEGCCEYDNKCSGSINFGKFLTAQLVASQEGLGIKLVYWCN
jgi:hypothetical protein